MTEHNDNSNDSTDQQPQRGGGGPQGDSRGGGGGGQGRRPPRGDGRGRRDRDDGDEPQFQEIVVKVNRCAKVMKGGRRFSFSALVVVGNRDGKVGFGFGKARAVPNAVEKGVKDAKKNLINVPRVGTTIPHQVESAFEASSVRLMPAAPGTGIVAGGTVRAVLELAGVKDVLTKSIGQTNAINLVKAAFKGLEALRTKSQIESLRGVTLG
ncbi:MAG: 30S ribosomal protein S5 [Planctomycetes bacterium]|nr:30S ribosomal protein S5 [Planctomycetota bacterium]